MASVKHQRARKSRRERGVALIIAVVSIALLTVVASEFAYNSRVDLELAANNRDEVRAYYLARSGVGMSRLLLSFQRQVNAMSGQLSQALSGMMGQLGGALGQAGAGGAGGIPGLPQPTGFNIQLWKMARVDCHMLKGLVTSEGEEEASPFEETPSGDGEGEESAGETSQKTFGSFQGCFLATIGDEEQKINVHHLLGVGGPGSDFATVRTLLDLMHDKRFEFLWLTEDSNGVKATPEEVLIALKDWMDEDEQGDALNPMGQGGGAFTRGFADENREYQRYEPRYRTKNSRFDTVDELYRVHGVNDRFMAAFRDRLTVYPDPNRPLNINSDDPMLMYAAILSVLDPTSPTGRNDPRLQNPLFVQELIERIKTARMFSFMGMSVKDFTAVVQSAGLTINPQIAMARTTSGGVSDSSETFSISSVGEAGNVQKTITTVVRIGQQDGPLGRLVYWREE